MSEAQLKRAREAVAEGRVTADEIPDLWWVESGDNRYRVQFIRDARGKVVFSTCSCPHGTHNGGSATCYHCQAVQLMERTRLPITGRNRPTVYARIDEEDYDRLSQFSWTFAGRGYARTGRDSRYLHRMVLETDLQVDHLNGDHLDCRRENLRPATNSQNHMGYTGRLPASGVRGVTLDKRRGTWEARVSAAGATHRKSGFKSIEAAVEWRNRTAQEIHGEFYVPSVIIG